MKRFAALIIAMSMLLCSCGAESSTRNESDTDEESMFVIVESTWYWDVVYHKDTKVMYTVSSGSRNFGNFTLLVNPDGSPMLWEGDTDD